MATTEQLRALASITCPWCQARPGESCSMVAPGGHARRDAEGGVRQEKRIPISTLDGGSHDARWQAAGLGSAPVLAAQVSELLGRNVLEDRTSGPQSPAERLTASERPW